MVKCLLGKHLDSRILLKAERGSHLCDPSVPAEKGETETGIPEAMGCLA